MADCVREYNILDIIYVNGGPVTWMDKHRGSRAFQLPRDNGLRI